MTSAVTTTPPRARTGIPDAEQIPPRGPGRRHVGMVAACYAGLALIVAVTVLLHGLLPRPVGAVIFLALAVLVVAVFHPRITLRR